VQLRAVGRSRHAVSYEQGNGANAITLAAPSFQLSRARNVVRRFVMPAPQVDVKGQPLQQLVMAASHSAVQPAALDGEMAPSAAGGECVANVVHASGGEGAVATRTDAVAAAVAGQ
jgi:hypothetical protein